MKKVLDKIHGFTGAIELAVVFISAIVAGFQAYTDKMKAHAEKEKSEGA